VCARAAIAHQPFGQVRLFRAQSFYRIDGGSPPRAGSWLSAPKRRHRSTDGQRRNIPGANAEQAAAYERGSAERGDEAMTTPKPSMRLNALSERVDDRRALRAESCERQFRASVLTE